MNGELLDSDVTLRDAREQWGAVPVSAVATTTEGDLVHVRAREHASKGDGE